jgi:hypothetical protein
MRVGMIGTATLAAAMLACGAGSDEELDERLEAWHAQEPQRYVVQTCTLGIEPPGCVRAVIEDGLVVAAEERIFHPSVPWWETIEPDQTPLDSMFERVRAGDQEGCSVDEVRYDTELGYIERYDLDCEGTITGGRWVACFEPGATDLGACEADPTAGREDR